MIVVDSSTVVAGLVDSGPAGRWAEDVLASASLAAPHLLGAEVTNVLRRAVAAGDITNDVASLALGDLAQLRVQRFPFEPVADRIWALRHSVTAYDAWYVAVAEWLDVPLATLDLRLTRAHGPSCRFLVPT